MIIAPSAEITALAARLHAHGFGTKDSLHLACAIEAKADCFLTVDRGIIKRRGLVPSLRIENPVDFFGKED